MKKLKQYHTFLNENLSVNKITIDELEKLFNDKTITIDNIPIKNDNNIGSYDLIRLAQGVETGVKNCDFKIMLENGIEFKTLRNIVRKSPLNKEGALFSMFMETHPMISNQ